MLGWERDEGYWNQNKRVKKEGEDIQKRKLKLERGYLFKKGKISHV